MFGTNFYYALTRKYVIVFGTLFNDITISIPYQDSGSKVKNIKVPITYGSLDKLLARVNSDPNLDKKVAAVTPAMSFLVDTPHFDQSRMLQSTIQRKYVAPDGSVSSQFLGIPYDLDFTLYIYADQEEQGLRVLENIIPYFTPTLTVTVKLLPEIDYEIDVPIVLNNIHLDNDSWGPMENRRKLIWTLNFTMKAQFLGPIQSGRKVIKMVIDNFYNIDSPNTALETVIVQPGLTANGEPTSDINETIPYTEINANDDFGYITRIIGTYDE